MVKLYNSQNINNLLPNVKEKSKATKQKKSITMEINEAPSTTKKAFANEKEIWFRTKTSNRRPASLWTYNWTGGAKLGCRLRASLDDAECKPTDCASGPPSSETWMRLPSLGARRLERGKLVPHKQISITGLWMWLVPRAHTGPMRSRVKF